MPAVFAGSTIAMRKRRRRSAGGVAKKMLAGLIAGLSLCSPTTFGQQSATPGYPVPSGNPGAAYPANAAAGAFRQTQYGGSSLPLHSAQFKLEQPSVTGQVDAIHSPNVDRLLKPQYKLDLERRHSQLVVTNKRITRVAVTDSTICNYVQYSETELSVVGLELGKTDLTLWFENEAAPAIYEITVVRDESLEEQRTIDFGRLERRMTTLFPNSRVYLIPVGNQVIVQGQAYDAEEAQHILQIVRAEVLRSLGRNNDLDNNNGGGNLLGGGGGGGGGVNGNNNNQNGFGGFRDIVINRLTVPGEYNIKMRVVVAELNRSQLRDMGLNVNVLFNDARHSVTSVMGGAPATLSGIFESGEIGVFLKYLNSNGTITLLAEPTLVTLSGHTASILGGGEFAVPTTIGLGGGQTTTFRGFGTSLLVTPTVIDRDQIRLQVVPEFSELNAGNSVNGIPGTNVKRVQTTVELREGQTLAIGGIISRQTLTQVSRIPLLGDIPYVGSRLFHSKTASEVETELLVLVTPEIVRPMEPDEVPPLPNHYVTHPNDVDLFKLGRTEGTPDTGVYQVAPYGSGGSYGVPQGYSLFNPPINHGGFVPGMNGNGAPMAQGYPTGVPSMGQQPGYGQPGMPPQSYGPTPVPQPEYQLPPGNYNPSPAQMQQFQLAPPAGSVPHHPIPSTQLPPIPQNYPAQGNRNSPTADKPSLMSKVGSVFRKEQVTKNSSVRPVSYSK